ncbi:hypothetical protein UFOVP696_4 [uncultured Caudovirales phage]|uniref:Uncharacterized protein n=1 Tax=uncultured Caudovirales phage TaxID=2100421 RepID=A0A6J5MIU8_9CAUD|nr:hypothetical protein UFOVP429_9 [uncultured Caudovirales phage]CAB4158100.1 hypothetical protein UFOVP696_4 [uncultured Caudovirales phage]
MPTTYTKIADVVVGAGGAATIDFTSIPQTFTDLVLKISVRSTRNFGWDGLRLRFNGSSTGYSDLSLAGNGATAFAFVNPFTGYIFVGDVNDAATTSNVFSNTEIYIPNYASSNNKSLSVYSVEENNATTAQLDLVAGLWSNSSATTSLAITVNAGNFVQHSTATLYGIKNA